MPFADELDEPTFTMPIIHSDPPENVTWRPTESDRRQALYNHSQTLERLRERCGLDWGELLAVLENRRFTRNDYYGKREAVLQLIEDRRRFHG